LGRAHACKRPVGQRGCCVPVAPVCVLYRPPPPPHVLQGVGCHDTHEVVGFCRTALPPPLAAACLKLGAPGCCLVRTGFQIVASCVCSTPVLFCQSPLSDEGVTRGSHRHARIGRLSHPFWGGDWPRLSRRRRRRWRLEARCCVARRPCMCWDACAVLPVVPCPASSVTKHAQAPLQTLNEGFLRRFAVAQLHQHARSPGCAHHGTSGKPHSAAPLSGMCICKAGQDFDMRYSAWSGMLHSISSWRRTACHWRAALPPLRARRALGTAAMPDMEAMLRLAAFSYARQRTHFSTDCCITTFVAWVSAYSQPLAHPEASASADQCSATTYAWLLPCHLLICTEATATIRSCRSL